MTFLVKNRRCTSCDFFQMLSSNRFWFAFPEFKRFDFFEFSGLSSGSGGGYGTGVACTRELQRGVVAGRRIRSRYLPDLFTATDPLGDDATVWYYSSSCR